VKFAINYLKLVYPPISNQVAEWLWDEPEVRDYVKHSKLYMLAQRHEILIDNFICSPESTHLEFDLTCGSIRLPSVKVSIAELTRNYEGEIIIEKGPQFLKIWSLNDAGETDKLIYWCTTYKFVYDHWRGRIKVENLERFEELTEYHLYYVGISKDNDSFFRLFKNGHKNRTKILSNETQFTPTGRLTDEVYIFLFDIEDLTVHVMDDENDLPPGEGLQKLKMVADAEKAFVSILDTKYNIEKYENFPKGADGLYNDGLARYCYLIDENITFNTNKATIVGQHNLNDPTSHTPDLIVIEGDKVTLVKAEDYVPKPVKSETA